MPTSKFYSAIFTFVCVVLVSAQVFAATIRVPQDQPTIQAGINSAVNGDTVLVSAGLYNERINFNGKLLKVVAVDGPLSTIIQGNELAQLEFPTVLFDQGENSQALLEGFTLRGGPIALRCVNSGPTIRRNIMTDQTYPSWAAVILEGPVRFENNTVCKGANGGIACYSTGADLRNNIIAFNAHYGIYGGGQPFSLAYNNVYGNQDDYQNMADQPFPSISVDPLFANLIQRNFVLLPNSPCINAGDPAAVYNDPDSTRNDMGALSSPATPYASNFQVGPRNTIGEVVSFFPSFSWNFFGPNGATQVQFRLQVGSDDDWTVPELWDTGPISSISQSVIYAGVPLIEDSNYFARVSVSDGAGFGMWNYASFKINTVYDTLRVPQDFSTVNNAIASSPSGSVILVEPGVYTIGCSVSNKTIILKSSKGPKNTSLVWDSSGSHCLFIDTNSIVAIEGFSFPAQNWPADGIVVNTSELSITNCSFSDIAGGNSLVRGYGVGSCKIQKCTFSSITIPYMLFFTDGLISRVVNNTIVSVSNGAILQYVNGSVAENNIISKCLNYGYYNGGTSAVERYNCFWGNTNNIYQNVPISGVSFVAQPMFKNELLRDYKLEPTSPCVNAGNPDPIYNDRDGSRNDIGAFEQVCELPILGSPSVDTAFFGVTYSYSASVTNITSSISYSYQFRPSWLLANSDSVYGSVQSNLSDTSFVVIATNECGSDTQVVTLVVLRTTPGADSLNTSEEFANLHVLDHSPQFDWDFLPYDGGNPQSQFEIAVGTDNNWAFAEKWNPAPFASADTFVVYDGSTLVDGATYYVRLRVNNGIAWSPWFESSFRMNSVPSVPVPASPLNGSLTANPPALTIANASDAENDPLVYDFALFADSALTNQIDAASGIPQTPTTTQWTPITLAENTRYYWRSRSYDGFEYSNWSSARSFVTNGVPEAPNAFALLSPDNSGLPVFDLTPTLSWQSAIDPDPNDTVRYLLEVAITPTFSFDFDIDSIPGNSYTLPDSLEFGRHYWWRVTAKDQTNLTTAGSNVLDFWTWTLGDLDHSHEADIIDLTLMVDHLFISFAPIVPSLVGDLNGDCEIDILDLTLFVDHLFITFGDLGVGCE